MLSLNSFTESNACDWILFLENPSCEWLWVVNYYSIYDAFKYPSYCVCIMSLAGNILRCKGTSCTRRSINVNWQGMRYVFWSIFQKKWKISRSVEFLMTFLHTLYTYSNAGNQNVRKRTVNVHLKEKSCTLQLHWFVCERRHIFKND